MVKVEYTPVQTLKQWTERVSLESHHESALPSQRYKQTRLLPQKLNPIVAQDVAETSASGQPSMDFPPGFLELNAPRQRPPLLGNPIFGYSTHPMPPPVTLDELPTRTTDRGRMSKASAANMAKLNELQAMLQEERKLRKELEAELAAARIVK